MDVDMRVCVVVTNAAGCEREENDCRCGRRKGDASSVSMTKQKHGLLEKQRTKTKLFIFYSLNTFSSVGVGGK
jgi:hypothetical protein